MAKICQIVAILAAIERYFCMCCLQEKLQSGVAWPSPKMCSILELIHRSQVKIVKILDTLYLGAQNDVRKEVDIF